MTKKINVAILQLKPAPNNTENNLETGLLACQKAAKQKADIILFPEMWNTGYQPFNPNKKDDYEKWLSLAITKNDPFIKKFQEQAKKLNVAILITYLEKYKNKPKNSATLIDRHGNIVITYSKVHTCDFNPFEKNMTSGKDFFVCDLDTAKGKVKTGIMICFDREFPESARILMLKGAELILVPNACPLKNDPLLGDVRIAQLRSRAFENMTAIAVANYPDGYQNCDGNSCAFNPDGSIIFQANGKEGIYISKFDVEKIRKFRKEEVWGNKFRKPECYKELV
ncbi:MAG: carbon-nitrogen hydrolase family protein [bacterium]